MVDWTVVADLGTATGTLVLACATFASVRSANRAAGAAEHSLQETLRPLLLTSRNQDPPEDVGFQDDHWVVVRGGHAVAEVVDDVVYLAIALLNAGNGLAVLNSWQLVLGRLTAPGSDCPDVSTFRRLNRDLYIAPHSSGFWQGAFRDAHSDDFRRAATAIAARAAFSIDLCYGDAEGGQRVITRTAVLPAGTGGDDWLAVVSRHWNLDRRNPR